MTLSDILLYIATAVFVFLPLYWGAISPWRRYEVGRALMYLFGCLALVMIYFVVARYIPREVRSVASAVISVLLIGSGIKLIHMVHKLQWSNFVKLRNAKRDLRKFK